MQNLNRQDYLGVPGIYAIQPINYNDRIYIGSTYCLYKRINGHINYLKRKEHNTHHLQNFVNKYGIENLKVIVLKTYDKSTPRDFLFKEEQKYINYYVNRNYTLFNSHKDVFFLKNNTSVENKRLESNKKSWEDDYDERKKIVIENLKKAKIGLQKWWIKIKNGEIYYTNPNLNKKSSRETRLKQSYSARKRGRNHSKTVYQYDLNGKFLKKWDSGVDFCLHMNMSKINTSNINRSTRDKSTTAYNYIWRDYYKEQLILQYLLVDIETNEKIYFRTPSCISKYLNVSKDVIRNRIKTGNICLNKYKIIKNDNADDFSYTCSNHK